MAWFLPKEKASTVWEASFFVAGVRHALYGKNPTELVLVEKQEELSSSSLLVAKTMPMLIRMIEPPNQEFDTILAMYQDRGFIQVSSLQVALITEITLD